MARWDLVGQKPDWFTTEQQRYIVATEEGWVYEKRYTTNVTGQSHVHREVIVTASGLSNSTFTGSPTITEIFVANSEGGSTLKHGLDLYIGVVFDEPVKGDATGWTLAVANTTTAGNDHVSATANSTLSYANNTLWFKFNANTAGPYKVQSQTISNTTNLVLSNNPPNEAVSRAISDAVSNTLGVFTLV